MMAFVQWQLARLNAFRPMRSWQYYNLQHGPLMSAGIGFNMFFSVLGLLATGFSIAGLVLTGQPELVGRVVRTVAQSAPGLLKVDGQEGLADPKELLNPTGLGVTAIIAAVVTVFTSLGWITSLRDGLRGVLGLPPVQVNAIILRLRDVGTLLLLGISLVLTSGVSIVFTAAVGFIAGLFGLNRGIVEPVGWLIGIIVPFLLNWLTAFIMFRLAGILRLSRRAMVEGTLIAGLGTSILQVFSSQLLARAGANPLLAPFAIIIGLLIWFNLVSQVYLVSAAWSGIRDADSVIPDRRRGEAFRTARPRRRAPRILAAARLAPAAGGATPSGRRVVVPPRRVERGDVHRGRPEDVGPATPTPRAAGRTGGDVTQPRAHEDGELRRPRRSRRRASWPVELLHALRRGARREGDKEDAST